MLYPILTVVCLLLRGHSSLQRKDSNLSHQNSNDLNTSINSCSIEELSKLLTDRLAMTRALELSADKHGKTKQQLVESILKLGTNDETIHFDANKESLSSKDNQISKNIDHEKSGTAIPQLSQIVENTIPQIISTESEPKTTHSLNTNIEKVIEESNGYPIDSYSYSFPLFFPHRNLKPPEGAKIKIQFKGKKREVSITVSPMMTVLEGLKQAEIKFKRIFKNIPNDSDLINFWWSPTLQCILVDKVSSVQNNNSMMWRLSVIDSNGEIEFEDYCLPANGQVFIRPGSTIQLIYTSIRDVTHIY